MRFSPTSIYKLPEVNGVYIFYDKNDFLLYIGKAKNIKKRVSAYFQTKPNLDFKTVNLVTQITSIDIIPVQSEFEALLLEAKLIKTLQPKYNVIWKDDKHYIYVKITGEEFPRILLSRGDLKPRSIYFGPFPSTRIIKDVLSSIRTIFPYCTQKESAKQSCFYTHLGLCNPCPAKIRKSQGELYKELRYQYLKNIRQIKNLLKGKVKNVRNYLLSQMMKAAQNQEYEQAAVFRDKLQNLDYLLYNCQPVEAYIEKPQLTQQTWKNEQMQLTNILRKFFTQLNLLKRIECYDISNISGRLATGSMVIFIDGQPAKQYYRRFRIKTLDKIDDFAMLSEVMNRRLRHTEWPYPDLLITDGGKPQLRALKKVMTKMKLNIPIIGLVKHSEELVIPDNGNFIKLKLPTNSPPLHLVQRLRDEAHRFAHRYHELLRLKHLVSFVEK